jgi:AcrR family transcriptional regulator
MALRSPSARERILHAAMEAFIEHGYAETSTLSIARRAKVSKRELYVGFGSKQAILAAGIADRAQRMRLPDDLPAARSRRELESVLIRFGSVLLREVSARAVIAVYRLAIAEANRSPEVARTLDQAGRQSARSAARAILGDAQSAGLLGAGDVKVMAEQFFALLWGDLLLGALLRVTEVAPGPALTDRAAVAASAFLRLYPPPAVRRGGTKHDAKTTPAKA